MNPDELLARSARNKAIWMAKKVKKAEVAQVTDGQVQEFQTIHETKPTKVAKRVKKTICPSEAEEQAAVIAWCDLHPIAKRIYSTQGGLRTSIGAARKAKQQGMRRGVPDLILDVPRRSYHGLRLELKRRKGGKTSSEQLEFGAFLQAQGYFWDVCCGAQEAIDLIKWYLGE